MTQTDIYIFNFLILSFSFYNWVICTITFFLDYIQYKFIGKYIKFSLISFFF